MPKKSIFSLVGLSESDGQAGDLQQQEHWCTEMEKMSSEDLGKHEEEYAEVRIIKPEK